MYARFFRWVVALIAIGAISYGMGRLYYLLTDGFAISHIYSSPTDLALTDQTALRTPTSAEQALIAKVLQQPFNYMGKGCQSYVFLSQDGDYVLKFVKHQRYRTTPWLDALNFLPGAASYQPGRLAEKSEKYNRHITGWKTAFNHLTEQTGVIWVHLDTKSTDQPLLTAFDKMGFAVEIDLNRCEYLVQKKAQLFMDVLQELIEQNAEDKASVLLDRLVAFIMDTYQRGFIDGDHAIIPNTGIRDGYPFQMDVGQLKVDASGRDPAIYKQGLFNKTYRLRVWLQEHSPALKAHLEAQLIAIIGEEFHTLKPHFPI